MSTARIDELRSKFEENPRRYFAPLANEYRKVGELTEAIALCREYLPKQPGHMSGHIVFGQALYENGDLFEAQEVFQAALGLDPENLIALRHLGDIARTRGDTGSARRWYERVLEADPRNDDIAALLASLAQRLTPRSATPVTPVAALPDLPVQSTVDDDPFSAPDSPAWHTPPFLTPLASPVISAENEAVVDTRSQPPEAPDDLLDFDFANDVFDAAPEEAEADEEVPELYVAAELDTDSVDSEDTVEAWQSPTVHSALASDQDPDSVDVGEVALSEETTEYMAPALGSVHDVSASGSPLDQALGAFAAHDPIDVAESLPMAELGQPFTFENDIADAGTPFAQESRDLESQLTDDLVEFEEGLVAQHWPEASSLVGRNATPARDLTPLSVEAVSEAFGAADESPTIGELEVDVAAEDDIRDADQNSDDAELLSDEDPPLSAAEIPWLSVSEEERETFAAYESEAAAAWDNEVALEPVIEAAASEAEPIAEAEVDAESVAETGIDADKDDHTPAESRAVLALESDRSGEADDDVLDDAPAASSPAFVTETMAELLVAQGFVDRAVTVYEELVSRRPYDAVLTSRLAELRAMAADDPEPSALENNAPTDIAARVSAAPTPAYGVTPAWNATPISGRTPIRSATPGAMPLVAPMARRTARELFATLAARRVARRTPAYGATMVASPTPADGLASLFGEASVPVDDIAARSLARAFGSDEGLVPGPSLFTPAGSEGGDYSATRGGTPASSTPPVPSSPAFSFDRFFPDPATTQASGDVDASPAPESAVTSGSEQAELSADPSSAGADLAQFSHWLKRLSNS